jgi:hypothetical protein
MADAHGKVPFFTVLLSLPDRRPILGISSPMDNFRWLPDGVLIDFVNKLFSLATAGSK